MAEERDRVGIGQEDRQLHFSILYQQVSFLYTRLSESSYFVLVIRQTRLYLLLVKGIDFCDCDASNLLRQIASGLNDMFVYMIVKIK